MIIYLQCTATFVQHWTKKKSTLEKSAIYVYLENRLILFSITG